MTTPPHRRAVTPVSPGHPLAPARRTHPPAGSWGPAPILRAARNSDDVTAVVAPRFATSGASWDQLRLPAAPGWPPATYTPMTQRGNPWGKWAVIGAAAGTMTIALGAVVILATGDKSGVPGENIAQAPSVAFAPSTAATNPTQTPPPIVAIDALPGLLPDPAVVNNIEGTTNIVLDPDPKGGNAFQDIQTDRPECQGIEHPAMLATLQGSGWMAAHSQVLHEPGNYWNHLITNAVIHFPIPRLANDFATKQAQAWARCGVRTLTSNAPGEAPNTWSVGTTTNHNGMLSVLLTHEGDPRWGCQRALTARNNIVVDTRSCGLHRTDQALAIATKIADRITAN